MASTLISGWYTPPKWGGGYQGSGLSETCAILSRRCRRLRELDLRDTDMEADTAMDCLAAGPLQTSLQVLNPLFRVKKFAVRVQGRSKLHSLHFLVDLDATSVKKNVSFWLEIAFFLHFILASNFFSTENQLDSRF